MSSAVTGQAPMLPRQWVFGVGYTPLGLEAALDSIAARPAAAPFAYVVTPNAQHVVVLNREAARLGPVYHDSAWLCLCDSQVVRRLAALAGTPLPLCAGSDLTVALFGRALAPGDVLAVVGCEDEVLDQLRAAYPAQRFLHHNPPMGFEHDEAAVMACIQFVERNPARYVFLATGSPRSELLAARIAARGLALGTGLCIGSSLHFLTGARQRAPRWMCELGLEWLFRLVQEPRRLWRRVVFDSLPLFRYAAPALLARALGRKRAVAEG